LKKKVSVLILVALLVGLALMPAQADETVVTEDRAIVFKIGLSHYLLDKGDGIWQTCQMDVAPYIKNSRTYVPVRYLAEGLGIPNQEPYIVWDASTNKVTIDGTPIKGNILNLYIGQKVIQTNGVKQTIDVAPETKSGRTMLPARYVLEGMGYDVTWDAKNQLVICKKGNRQIDIQAVVKKIKELEQSTAPPPNQLTYENDKIAFDPQSGWPTREECLKYGHIAFKKHVKIDRQNNTVTFDLPTAPKGSLWWINIAYEDSKGRDYWDQFNEQTGIGNQLGVKGGHYVVRIPFKDVKRGIIGIGLAKEGGNDQTPSAIVHYDIMTNTYKDVITEAVW